MSDLSLLRKNFVAIGFALGASCGFTLTDTISKYLTQSYSIPQVICLVNVFTVIVTLVWLLKYYGVAGFKTRHLKWHLIRGLSITCTAYCVVNAFARIPLADFYGIVFLSPLVTLILSHFLLKELVGWHRLLATVIGFIGVLVLAGPQFDTHNSGIIFALCAVIFICINALVGRKMKEEKNLPLFALFPSTCNMLANLPFMLADFTMPTGGDLALYVAVGPLLVFALVCASLSLAKATETAVIMPFSYIQILFGAALGYVLFGDVPTLTTAAGCAIIIGSGLYALWREHLHHVRGDEKKIGA